MPFRTEILMDGGMEMRNNMAKQLKYHAQLDVDNQLRLRNILNNELPEFCKLFFRGIESTTSSRTRIAYAYDLTVIRPLMYVSESEIIGFKNKYDLPVAKNPCPADGYTKREYVKNLVRQLNLDNPGVKKRLFHAIENGNIDGWNINNKL